MTPEPMRAEAEGLAFTPDVVLFIGGLVLTVAVIAVLGVFWMRILRAERKADAERRGGGA